MIMMLVDGRHAPYIFSSRRLHIKIIMKGRVTVREQLADSVYHI
jgi:hypothetical protein